ncbi:manganese-binding transcriptional regulator MntR [Ahrensia marina]|uniref:Transcriptional regulator MntR n=1 Tax=Ahrensia marina TaxID=1514904 RepID=A0A0M9GKR8_9HYPH|nr:manganese-binding transcriptional regulator MntR [Ahrensia marina]KPB00060.1 manganese transporter [Ahrensia marina]
MKKTTAKALKFNESELQVHGFRQTRHNRRLELVEDYVELIADLIEKYGEARQVDIAKELGVAQPTVSKTLKRLVAEKMIIQRPYRGVFLTDKGSKLAKYCRQRHALVETFLTALGVPSEVAKIDAEGIEHHVSDQTIFAFKRFLKSRQVTEIRKSSV